MANALRMGLAASTLSLLATIIACGASDDSGEGGAGRGGLMLTGGNGGDGGPIGGGTLTPDSACASAASTGQRLPLHLVLLLDRSLSMEAYDDNTQHLDLSNPDARWNQVTGALSSFFASPDSSGVIVSLILFPSRNQNQWCSAAPYATPAIHDVALPDSTQLPKAMKDNNPAAFASTATPTSFALQGAVAYAQSIRQTGENSIKVAMVMATDGYPQNCQSIHDGDVQPACAEASKAAASSIPLYVIGVGAQLTNLNELASSGGTESAYLISTSSPASIGTALLTALNTIRGAILSCEYALPPPPTGQELDLNKVNLNYTPSGGSETTLLYDGKCTGPGWHYDDASTPTRIIICPETCNTIKADTGAKVQLLVGCQRQEVPVK